MLAHKYGTQKENIKNVHGKGSSCHVFLYNFSSENRYSHILIKPFFYGLVLSTFILIRAFFKRTLKTGELLLTIIYFLGFYKSRIIPFIPRLPSYTLLLLLPSYFRLPCFLFPFSSYLLLYPSLVPSPLLSSLCISLINLSYFLLFLFYLFLFLPPYPLSL